MNKRRHRKGQRERILEESLPSLDDEGRPLTETERLLLHSYAKENMATTLFPEFDEKPRRRRR